MNFTAVNPPKKRKGKKKAGTRKWGSPAQRKAFAKMIAARKSSSPSRKRRSAGGTTVATKKKRRKTATKPRSRRRSYSRRGFAGMPVVIAAGAGTAGIMLANQIIPRLPIPDNMKTPTGMGLIQIGLGVAIATVGRRVLGKYATPMGVGVATMGGVQLAASIMNRGVSGLGYLDTTPALLSSQGMGYLDSTPALTAGLGSPLETETYG